MTSRELALAASLDASAREAPLHDVLADMLTVSGLSRRDRALAEEIALGALRRRLQVDLVLARASARPLDRMQKPLLEALRQAAYQVMFLDRVPAHAAVNEAVTLVKARLGKKPGAFANAVLRAATRLVAEKNVEENIERPEGEALRRALHSRDGRFLLLSEALLPPPEGDLAGWLSGSYGYPQWMVERWLARHGPGRAEAILEWGNTAPPLTVRLNARKVSAWPLPDGEAVRVFGKCSDFAPGEVEMTYKLAPEVAPAELPGLAAGLYSFQDETQARPANVLAPPEGATVLDLCAGLGTKSAQLAELVGPEGRVVAVEIDAAKAARAREAALRLGHDNIALVEADATSLAGPAAREYSHVLLDAPCSNLGALDRRPEVRFRTNEDAIRRLAENESELLAAAAARVAPGGALVYSVCTFEAEETEEVARRFLEARSDFALDSEYVVLPEPGRRDGGYAARLVRAANESG
jgi:16S rRNA (cytosine967-C5)-methyltransferase